MPDRYITKPRQWWSHELEEEMAAPTTITIVEETDDPIETGLLDRHGNPLYRVRERRPMGFKVKA